MQLARDGKIILDLDDTIETNYISIQLKCSSSPWKQKHTRPHDKVNIELISFLGQELITIQFGSLESAVVPIESKEPLTETDLFVDVSDKADDNEEGWTLVTHWRLRKQSQVQSPHLSHRNR